MNNNYNCVEGCNIPSSPVNGLSYFETNNNKLMTYYSGHWYYADGTVYNP